MNGFADAIGLDVSWPVEVKQQDEMSVVGLITWARTYLSAGEILHFTERPHEPEFYAGPVMHMVGLATELTIKTMLRGRGKTSDDLKKYGHNTYKAYFDARACFDETKFINLHFSNTAHLPVPKEVEAILGTQGETEIETKWRFYFNHLRILDGVYDRPFRNRYVAPGLMILPEAEIILCGTKILLSAMEERLADRN